MPGREGRFEPGLAAQQPSHGAIPGIRVCRFDMRDRAQRWRGKETSDEHGENQRAMPTFLGRDEPIEAQAAHGP
jgi:hypothetical protein